MVRAGALVSLGLLSACGSSPRESAMTAFSRDDASIYVMDSPSADGLGSTRSLQFILFANYTYGVSKPDDCPSLGDATATFGGRPLVVRDPGGFRPKTGECAEPLLDNLAFDMPAGEPQNGTLVLDGSDLHLEMTFHHDFGAPRITLVSVAADKIVASLQGFAQAPTLNDVQASIDRHVLSGYPPTLAASLRPTALSPDGQLEISIPPGYVQGSQSTTLGIQVNLGDDRFPCSGFLFCTGSSLLWRTFSVDLPPP